MKKNFIKPDLCEFELEPAEVAKIIAAYMRNEHGGHEVTQVMAFDTRMHVRTNVPTVMVYMRPELS